MENECHRTAASAGQWFDRVTVEPNREGAVCSRKQPSREGPGTVADFQQMLAGYQVDGSQDTAND